MDSKENQIEISSKTDIETQKDTEASLVETSQPQVCEAVPIPACETKNASQEDDDDEEEDDDDDDDIIDIDLCAVEIASALAAETFSLDGPQLVVSDNEAYKNIMSMCSDTAQSIKKTITDVLNSRERVIITEVDPTTELQESLNRKIADFEKVVSGCLAEDTESDPKTSDNLDDGSVDIGKDTAGESIDPSIPEESACVGNSEASDESKNDISKSDEISKKMDDKVLKSADKKPETSGDEVPVQSDKVQNQPSSTTKETGRSTISGEEEKSSKKQKNGASKKKGEKIIDQVLKSLGNGSAEEKLQLLVKKHVEALEEYRLVEPRLKQLERQIITQQREKEQLQAEHNRMILAKSRLEGLCREMQRQSKAIKEESLLRIKEEEEKRKEIANKFQSTLNDITALMQENSKKNLQLREENAELATKLKSLVDNYEVWEQNMQKVVHQKELEAQLAKAKHAKVNLLLKQDNEKFLMEKKTLLENLSDLQKRCTILTSNELQLRNELGDYTSKYEEFQSVLTNSSKVFSTFKTDMESTSKKIKKLEKETNVYKQKWESSNNALLDMISHKEKQDKEFSNAQQRILTLEKLCRALQAERNELQNQMNVLATSTVPAEKTDVPSLSTEAGVA